MTIKTKLTEKDFIRAFFTTVYSKVSMKLYTGIALFLTILLITQLAMGNGYRSASSFLIPFVFFIGFPIVLYFMAKKSYAANKRISELIEYRFDKDFLVIKGESFTTQFTWDKIYKVSHTKSLLLIWQTKQLANVIPKRDIWEGDIAALKEILAAHHIKNNL